ncbi:hypothetical protein [Nocardiopsis sp. CNS-639]|uniref:hypothetical protein n=1 Tax=Nocardiopsis sp. CNS-639 TaxID=1169153 RepID=UPI000373E333|nr:hypothetical protein [Nocardiopsis sp. CNS-639]
MQIRTGAEDTWLQGLLSIARDGATDAAGRAERALLAVLDGGCYVSIEATAALEEPGLGQLGQVTTVDSHGMV